MTPEPTVAVPEREEVRSAPARSSRRVLLHLIALGVGGVVVIRLFPSLMGTRWPAIGSALAAVPPAASAGLVILWAAGLGLHSITLTAALPGLSHRRALMLSLTGSALSNVLPLGGAAGIALNYRMSRTWGFSGPAIATFTVVSNVCDVVMKLLLPLLLVPLVLRGSLPRSFSSHASLPVSAGLPVATAAVAVAALLLLVRPRVLVRARGVVTARPGFLGPGRLERLVEAAEQVTRSSRVVLVRSWSRLSLGMALYTLFLMLLLVACLRTAGADVPLSLVFTAFCAERLLTLVGLTPAGLGFVELGLAGLLMLAPGVGGADVASGILLYRILTVGLEIPVGGVMLALWTWQRSSSGGRRGR
jgi:putative heme transporter